MKPSRTCILRLRFQNSRGGSVQVSSRVSKRATALALKKAALRDRHPSAGGGSRCSLDLYHRVSCGEAVYCSRRSRLSRTLKQWGMGVLLVRPYNPTEQVQDV